jgi:hypothetical protein
VLTSDNPISIYKGLYHYSQLKKSRTTSLFMKSHIQDYGCAWRSQIQENALQLKKRPISPVLGEDMANLLG